MINIGIYTKNSQIYNLIESNINRGGLKQRLQINIIKWTSIKNATFVMEDDFYDSLIIDISSANFGLHSFLRNFIKCYPHSYIIIIFDKFESLDWILNYKIHSFIYKKNIVDELRNIFIPLLENFGQRKTDAIELISKRKYEKIYFKDILYITRRGKYAEITTLDNRVISYRSSLVNLYENLNDKMFIYIDKGCIINVTLIRKVTCKCVDLINNKKVQISREGLKRLMRLLGDKEMPKA